MAYDPNGILLQSMLRQQNRGPNPNETRIAIGRQLASEQQPVYGWGDALANLGKSAAGSLLLHKGLDAQAADQAAANQQTTNLYNQMMAQQLGGGGGSISPVSPEKFSPQSLAKFQQSGDYTALQPIGGGADTGIKIGNVSPGDFTPESLAAFQKGGDLSQLVRNQPAAPAVSIGAPSPEKFTPESLASYKASGDPRALVQTPEGDLAKQQKNDLTSIDQQASVMQGAIKDIQDNPNAFGGGNAMKLGAASILGQAARSAAERNLYTPDQIQARSKLFNQVSAVIKERAGAAQSKQELERITAFLPGEYDDAPQILAKLAGYQQYLGEKRSGIVPYTPGTTAPAGQAKAVQDSGTSQAMASGAGAAMPMPKQGDVIMGHTFLGGDPKNPKSWAKQ